MERVGQEYPVIIPCRAISSGRLCLRHRTIALGRRNGLDLPKTMSFGYDSDRKASSGTTSGAAVSSAQEIVDCTEVGGIFLIVILAHPVYVPHACRTAGRATEKYAMIDLERALCHDCEGNSSL